MQGGPPVYSVTAHQTVEKAALHLQTGLFFMTDWDISHTATAPYSCRLQLRRKAELKSELH